MQEKAAESSKIRSLQYPVSSGQQHRVTGLFIVECTKSNIKHINYFQSGFQFLQTVVSPLPSLLLQRLSQEQVNRSLQPLWLRLQQLVQIPLE
jgi:hypothetical protein